MCGQLPGSLPLRGAWIEIHSGQDDGERVGSRSPCGERGLKFNIGVEDDMQELDSRSPCGERGLKLPLYRIQWSPPRSLPLRGAWIEIQGLKLNIIIGGVAPLAGSVD